VNRNLAEHFATRWVILSAKYGFIDPDHLIPGHQADHFTLRLAERRALWDALKAWPGSVGQHHEVHPASASASASFSWICKAR
jgi:hypothetical protein